MKEYLYIIFIFAAFLSSLSVYRLDIIPYKIVALVITIDLVSHVSAAILHAGHHDSIGLCNISLLLDFSLYALYYRRILRFRWARQWIGWYLIVLILFWFVSTVLIIGFDHWNAYFSVFGNLFTVLLSIAYYRQLFSSIEPGPLRSNFEFWIATALIVFFACTLPYFGMLHYLSAIFRPMAKKGLSPFQLINILFYSIVTYAFLCRINTRKSWQSS